MPKQKRRPLPSLLYKSFFKGVGNLWNSLFTIHIESMGDAWTRGTVDTTQENTLAMEHVLGFLEETMEQTWSL